MASETTRISVKVRKELKVEFLEWMKKFNISKDHFLRAQLPTELQYLKMLPVNPDIGRLINSRLGIGTERLSLTLPVDLAQEIEKVCDAKGIKRDVFIDFYLDFLMYGDEEAEIASPLVRLEEILENPRKGYSIAAHGNPYRHLHWDEESAKEFLQLFQKGNTKTSATE